MTSSRILGAAGLLALLVHASASHAAAYYVDPDTGNDDNNGTKATAPWKTLARAQEQLASGDTLHLASAKVFTEPLVLRSGVSYDSSGSAPAILSGARRVDLAGTQWTKDPAAPIYTTKLPARLVRQGVSQVFIGGQKLILARTPNIGQGDFKSVPGSQFARVTADGDQLTLNIDPRMVPPGASVRGATAMIRLRGSDLGEYTVNGWKPGSGNTSLDVKAVSFTEDWYIANEYTIPAGHGYWLENKRWMLDSPREWFFDADTRELHIWAPNGQSPQGQNVTVSVLPNGIVGKSVNKVQVSNLRVADTASDGISLVAATHVTLNKVQVQRAGRRGIAIAGSSDDTINGATVEDSAADGIWLGFWSTYTPNRPPNHIRRSENIDILNSRIVNSGTRGYAQAAVRLGEGGRFANNVVQNTPYLGVSAPLNNTIENNLILNSCSAYEDCGAIYVAQPPDDPAKASRAGVTTPVTRIKLPNNVVIRNNIVDGGTGSADGVPDGQGTDTRGIYLDDYANGVKVLGNYVTGMKYGIMLHTAFNNELSDNLAIRNRSNNIFLEEHPVPDLNPRDALRAWVNGEMRENVFARNAMVASKDASSAKRAIPNIQHISHGNGSRTGQFASYRQNQYATLNPVTPNVLAYNYGADQKGREDMDLATWRSIGNDNNGSARQYRSVTEEAYGFYNSSRTDKLTVKCPASVAANCGKFVDLKKSEPVAFPLTLEPGAAIIVVR